MPTNRFISHPRRSALFLALVLAALPAAGAEIDRIASFSAGDPPPCSDTSPEIASQPGGSFLLLWSGSGCPPDRFFSVVRALRFDAAGRRFGDEVELWQGLNAVVVPLADGGFLAVSARESVPEEIQQPKIRLHRLDSLGRPVGEPVQVAFDFDEFSYSDEPRLAVAPNGTVAVVWSNFNFTYPPSFRVMGRFYDASLAPLTEAFPLSTAGQEAIDETPDIAFDSDGTALAIWAQTPITAPDAAQIIGRRFSSAGQPLSEVFPISLQKAGRRQIGARVVSAIPAGWWAAWQSYEVSGDSKDAHLTRLGSDGQALAAEQSLDVPQSGQERPALGIDGEGRALLLGRSVDGEIVGRLFDPNGVPRSNPFELSEGGDRLFDHPTLSDTSASFTTAWTGREAGTFYTSDLSGMIFTSPCLPGRNAVCLGPEGRYGVEIEWQIGAQRGTAKPLPLAGNVATFGLRNTADHEVTVLLSGTGLRDLTYAATTRAALAIRVTDKTTGTIHTFSKPAGRFASRRFPNALPLASSDPDAAVGVSSADEEAEPARAALAGTCVPSSRALCLLGGRFQAELLAGQHPRPALATLRTDQSGMFSFPSAALTPVVALTVIDGRASTGKFWVYLGGLSANGYKVRITDLATGKVRTYANPAGRLDSSADRHAF